MIAGSKPRVQLGSTRVQLNRTIVYRPTRPGRLCRDPESDNLGLDLQNILRQSYDYLTIMPKLRSTYDGRLIHETSYEERKDFLMCNSLAKS